MAIEGISGSGSISVSGINKLQKKAGGEDFLSLLKDSIDKVNYLQLNAEQAMQKLAKGEVKDLHEVMVAVEEANLAFMTMMQIRNKLLDAYQELMRMQM